MSTRTNIRLITFCMFLILSMLVVSSVLIFTAGQQDIQSLITIEFTAEKIKLNFANYDGTVVTPGNCNIVLNDDGTKFKIVGPTPVIEGSTSTQSSGPTGKVSSIDDLTNNSGAEFYYFCTNSAVVGTLSYLDPGTVYYTSTADSTLESWYDLLSSNTSLYACFMTPNYTTEEVYSGSDTQIVISNKVTNIPYNAFFNKSSITDVAIPQSVKNIGYVSYSPRGAFQNCSKLQKVVIPNSVTSIGDSAFRSCSGLTSITIPDRVTSIGDSVFFECSGLTIVTIGSSVTSIGGFMFFSCTGLASITIPERVTSIGEYAFSDCSKLTSITFADTSKTWTVNSNTISVSNPTQNATYLKSTYVDYEWTKNS